MENIPREYTDFKTKKKMNLQTENLDRAATFVADDLGLTMMLISKEWERNREGDPEPIDGTNLTLKFTDGKLTVKNKKVMEIVMTSSAYANGLVSINPMDPSGLWRELGMIVTETVQRHSPESVAQPKFDDCDFKKINLENELPDLQKAG